MHNSGSGGGSNPVRRAEPPERKLNMGATHVTATIRNPADPDRAWEELFLDQSLYDSRLDGSLDARTLLSYSLLDP